MGNGSTEAVAEVIRLRQEISLLLRRRVLEAVEQTDHRRKKLQSRHVR